MSSRRPRRSRIYDLNYNIGENYYKSALDRLDEKNSRTYLTRRSEPPISSPPKSRFLTQLSTDGGLDDDLDTARDRASKAIQRETILDQRTGRKALELEADFDSQVSKTLERIQASKKLLSSIDTNDYVDEAAASSASVFKKRVLKVTTDVSSSSASAADDSLTKWTKFDARGADDSESFAALRAKKTMARLQDIEQDMADRSERQFLREQRAANVKKILAESSELADDFNGLSNGVSSLKITKRTQKQITSY